MIRKIKQFKFLILAGLLYIVFFIFNREIFFNAIGITKGFLAEMIQVLPPVMILSALITVWVPSKTIQKGLGEKAGIKGRFLSILIGSVSAGPIYAAFPAALVLFKKGASISNMVIILSSWAVIKIPMLMVEIQFLGLQFSLTRFFLTIPAVLGIGLLTEKLVKRSDIKEEDKEEERIELPNLNCGGCGFSSCDAFRNAIIDGEKTLAGCIVLTRGK
ncbi:Fe-S cluster protein [Thiospirochaeta perfilievii]|uniref:Fe-S cluster protein n=1 Tax=Thiospirochaeta perfilievii TaxID=252967 RepID=A0A5C1QFI5_9SPIO|nr:permease [Thiospirochaeta perfilievii]QEN05346.1 Fe-S cluster protein [Thiospirochaeta perfilievii]